MTEAAASAAAAPVSSAPDSMPPHCLIILGRQGSGKGTQSLKLTQKFGFVHVSTGDMLREAAEAGTAMGLRAKELMEAGELVPDDIMCELLAERVAQPDVQKNGLLLDGFPRTVPQAEALEKITGQVLGVINLELSIAEATQRMLNRNRPDDTAESIARRLELYEKQTEPLLSWYASRYSGKRKPDKHSPGKHNPGKHSPDKYNPAEYNPGKRNPVVAVDGSGTEEEVFARLAEATTQMLESTVQF